MQKTPYVFPVVGGRKVEHLEQNLEGLDIALSEEQIKYLESVLSFDVGFPHNFIVSRMRSANMQRLYAHIYARRAMVRIMCFSKVLQPISRDGPASRRFVLPNERKSYGACHTRRARPISVEFDAECTISKMLQYMMELDLDELPAPPNHAREIRQTSTPPR